MRALTAPDVRNTGARSLTPGGGSGAATTLLMGIEANSANGHAPTWTASKIKGDRGEFIEYSYNEAELIAHLEGVKASYTAGCVPVILIEVSKTYLGNIVPATYAAKFLLAVQAVREKNPGKPYYVFEIINEPYNCGEKGSNAKDYALICKAVYEAVEGAAVPMWPAAGGVMLLCAAHLTYQKKTSEKVAGEFSDYTTGHGWMRDFLEAWPESKTKVNGWTSHPYGEPKVAASAEGNNNIRSAKLQHDQAVELGFGVTGTNNWWITEVGYGLPPVVGFGAVATEALQASKLGEALEEMLTFRAEGWLKAVIVFADQGAEWGLFGKTGQGILTAFGVAHGE